MDSFLFAFYQRQKRSWWGLNETKPIVAAIFFGTMPDLQSVLHIITGKKDVPTPIFLTRLGINHNISFLQFSDKPARDVIAETARVDKIIVLLSGVKHVTLEQDHITRRIGHHNRVLDVTN
jgi:hypothetical protein